MVVHPIGVVDVMYPLDENDMQSVEALTRDIAVELNGTKIIVITDDSPTAISIGGIISKTVDTGDIISSAISEECQQFLVEKIKNSKKKGAPLVIVAANDKIDDFKMQILKVLVSIFGPVTFAIKAVKTI